MQHLNSDFNEFKVNDSAHVKMLVVQEMWQKLLNHSCIITKHWVQYVQYIIINEKCNMWIMVLIY